MNACIWCLRNFFNLDLSIEEEILFGTFIWIWLTRGEWCPRFFRPTIDWLASKKHALSTWSPGSGGGHIDVSCCSSCVWFLPYQGSLICSARRNILCMSSCCLLHKTWCDHVCGNLYKKVKTSYPSKPLLYCWSQGLPLQIEPVRRRTNFSQ